MDVVHWCQSHFVNGFPGSDVLQCAKRSKVSQKRKYMFQNLPQALERMIVCKKASFCKYVCMYEFLLQNETEHFKKVLFHSTF